MAWLGVAAVVAAAAPWTLQLAFAIFGIGVVGMVHGAGDLAVVAPVRRRHFLVAYDGLVSLVTLLWWTLDPAVALPAFLVASAIHFGMEDAPEGPIAERVVRGVALIAAPATLHAENYAALLRSAGGMSSMLDCTPWLAVAGGVCGAILLWLAWRRRQSALAGATAALLLLPPLVGFTLGFLVLHALPQTLARRDRLGCASIFGYLRSVVPVFAGALVLAGSVAALLLHFDPSGVRGLFGGIAALAVPHLLVTPWFECRAWPVPRISTPAASAGTGSR